jgi:hypothetical protein
MNVVRVFLILICLLMTCAVNARAEIIMTVVPHSAPNVFGSPSVNQYRENALFAIEHGSGNIGDRTTDPTAYEIAGPFIEPGDIVVSGFHSWRGVADPAAPFHNEYGNRLHFGLRIVGGGNNPQFRLVDLQFSMSSTDSFNALAFAGNFVGLDYNVNRYGIDYGPDRVKGGGDDIRYTVGNGLTFVDEIGYFGVGNALDATAEPGLTNQDRLDSAMSYIYDEGPFNISCVYTLKSPDGSVVADGGATVTVPAPGAGTLLGFAGFATTRRQRRAA